MNMDYGSAPDSCGIPRIAHFPVEDLSPTAWQAEHERVRAELGDEAYLALRQAEIREKMDSIVASIKAGKWRLPPPKGSQEPDRIGLANGREFRVGVAQGVPEEITEAMWEALDAEDGIREVPEEWLEHEIPKAQLEEEEKQDKEKHKQRAVDERRQILEGQLSVRNIAIGCPSTEEGVFEAEV